MRWGVNVPVGDTTRNGSRRTNHPHLLDENEISETLRDFNTKHYGQANKTVFGGGDYYTLLTDKPMTNPIYKKILEGSFAERPDLTAAQKLWSRHMRSKVPDGTDKERMQLA